MANEKPVIGETNCPVCGKVNEVKLNKNKCGYFHCTGCFNGVFSKAKTRELFLEKKPNYEEIANAENEPKAPEGQHVTHTAATKQPAETVDGNGGILDWWDK